MLRDLPKRIAHNCNVVEAGQPSDFLATCYLAISYLATSYLAIAVTGRGRQTSERVCTKTLPKRKVQFHYVESRTQTA